MKVQQFANVWDALESSPAEAAIMTARSELMMAVHDAVERWDVTRAKAAKRLKITETLLNDLLKGRISKFNLDTLVKIATRAGLNVTFEIKKKAA